MIITSEIRTNYGEIKLYGDLTDPYGEPIHTYLGKIIYSSKLKQHTFRKSWRIHSLRQELAEEIACILKEENAKLQ